MIYIRWRWRWLIDCELNDNDDDPKWSRVRVRVREEGKWSQWRLKDPENESDGPIIISVSGPRVDLRVLLNRDDDRDPRLNLPRSGSEAVFRQQEPRVSLKAERNLIDIILYRTGFMVVLR